MLQETAQKPQLMRRKWRFPLLKIKRRQATEKLSNILLKTNKSVFVDVGENPLIDV